MNEKYNSENYIKFIPRDIFLLFLFDCCVRSEISFILFFTVMFVAVIAYFFVNWCILEELRTFFFTYVRYKRLFLLDLFSVVAVRSIPL